MKNINSLKQLINLITLTIIFFVACMPAFSQCPAMNDHRSLLGGNISQLFPATSVTSGKYTVEADIVIDKPFTFDGAVVKFASGAGIILRDGVTLTITNSTHLTSCSEGMWKGIYVQSKQEDISNIIIDNSSIIEAAITGIKVNIGYSK